MILCDGADEAPVALSHGERFRRRSTREDHCAVTDMALLTQRKERERQKA